jgi:hypothetical protein
VGKLSVCCGGKYICSGGGGGTLCCFTLGMPFVELAEGMLFVELAVAMLFVKLAGGMLFVELMNDVGDWLWHSGRTDNWSELDLDFFGGLVAERARGRIENIDGGADPIVWCN